MPFNLDDLTTDQGVSTPPPVLHTEFPDIIDNTAREQFRTCPQRFLRSSIQHIAPARKSIHLHAGGAYAAGLEVMRREFYDKHASPADALAAGVDALIRFYGAYEPYDNDIKTCERMVGALLSYTQQYPLEHDTVKPFRYSPTKSAIEFTFAIPLEVNHPQTGMPILYAGRFDMLGERDGTLFVVDDKTTFKLGPTWGSQWDLNSQFTGYVFAAKNFDLPVAGAIIRGQSILKNDYGHAQAITYRPQWQIDRWYEQLHRDIEQMIESWRTGVFDFALGASCTSYSGCEFKLLCTTQNPEEWIPINFTQRHWNPTQKDPEAPTGESAL